MSTGLITEMNGMIDRLQAENKRLLAINADLLEACQAALMVLDDYKIAVKVRAAIAKATTPIISPESKP